MKRRFGKVCTTIAAETCSGMAEKATAAFALGTDLVELRMDLLAETPPRTISRELSHLARRAVVTVRRRPSRTASSTADTT